MSLLDMLFGLMTIGRCFTFFPFPVDGLLLLLLFLGFVGFVVACGFGSCFDSDSFWVFSRVPRLVHSFGGVGSAIVGPLFVFWFSFRCGVRLKF